MVSPTDGTYSLSPGLTLACRPPPKQTLDPHDPGSLLICSETLKRLQRSSRGEEMVS